MTDELLLAAEHMEANQLLAWIEVCEKALQTGKKELGTNLVT